ncbi:ribosomal biogenesis protein LAS1L [Rana temporaria]|uniref:ribosomal biogenesis protein LAS1L n=1 Tax=Rana temporaria TaxID=8407 RepID=UPI001AAC98EA|nr:ribosomal biogenesis protein LAS1L [Rana temporaria]
MAGKRQVVAWISKAEWEQVLEYLYSRDSKLQRDALHQLSAWKSRYGNSIPLAVECTADLVRCKILDVNGGMGEQELASLYGLALVRFVNIITENKQKTIIIPLRRLANELNIPEWVVNIRHSATHGKMPKLSMCRKGWDFVMEWLRREYWSRQLGNSSNSQWVSEDEDSEDMEEVLPPPSVKEQKETIHGKLREAFRSYSSEQFKIFQELQNDHKSNKSWHATSNLEWIIAQIKELIQQNSCHTAVDILVDDGLMIPTAKQLMTLRIEQEDPDDNLYLPRTLLRFWQPLLKVLHSHLFTQVMLEKMFSELSRCKENNAQAKAHYLSCWISEILTANHRAGADGKTTVPSRTQATVKSKWKLFNHRVFLQWKQLMQKCLEFPCQTTPQLLRLIFLYMKPRLPSTTQEKLLCLCSIYTQNEDTDVSVDYSNQPIYTVESLQWRIKQESKVKVSNHWDRSSPEDEDEDMSEPMEDEDMITESYEEEYVEMINVKTAPERRAALEGSAWSVSSEFVKWSEYPLGLVPGQMQDPSCLLIESYSMMSVLEQQESEARKNGQSITMCTQNMPSSENIFWTQNELNHIKAGLRLF